MLTRQGSNLTSLRSIQQFLDANAGRLGRVSTSSQRRRLDALVQELDGHAHQQATHDVIVRGATKSKASLARELRERHMRPIAKVAAAESEAIPALDAFRLPRGGVAFERLVEMANGMAEAAVPYAQIFVDAGLPASFLDELRAASSALVAATSRQKVTMGIRRGATQGLAHRTSTTRKVVAALDALVRRSTTDEALLSNWRTVKHVRRASVASAPEPAPAAS